MTRFTLRVLIFASMTACGCSRASDRRAYATELEQAHALADRTNAAGDTKKALQALERAFMLPPEGEQAATLPLRQDLADRIAQSYLQAKEPRPALDWARRGLALAEDETVLRATLLITEADALEALGQRDEARAALMSALEINQTLLHVELEQP